MQSVSVAVADVAEQQALERRGLQSLSKKWRADDREAWGCLALTALLWVGSLTAVHLTGGAWWAVLVLAMTIARCFMVFHDAAHMSFFESAANNRMLGQIMQFTVNYSYRYWESIHNSHHSHFGDSTVRDNSLTIIFSEKELEEASLPVRVLHRIIRDPIVFYPLASLFVFFINKPFTHGLQRIVIPLLLWATLGAQTAGWYMVAAWICGMIGVASFHVQHHANSAYRVANNSERSALDAAILGSTRIKIPFPLSLFSLGIEYHHIHHFDVRIPGYRLQRCDAEGEALGLWSRVNTLSGLRVFKSLFHTQFEGDRKVADAETGELPRCISFWPYSALGLQDA